MGIPIVRGRAFTEDDEMEHATTRKIAIVNETMAAKFWPGQDPIGKRFRVYDAAGPLLEVVGVARDSKYVVVFESPRTYVYLPVVRDMSLRTLIVRDFTAAFEQVADGPDGCDEHSAGVVDLRCYSNMTSVPDTGDFGGLTVLLLLNDRGTSVVVQEGLGGLEPAFVAQTAPAHDGIMGDDLVVTSPQAETMRLKSSCE